MSAEDSFGGARNLVDLIDQLVEPVPPPPVSMVPQTAGWWVLGLAVIATLCVFGLRTYRAYQRNAYRRAALWEIDAAGTDMTALSSILKRTALAAYPRRDVAGLSGDAWLRFLDDTVSSTAFTAGVGKALATAPYQQEAVAEPALIALVKSWVRDHRGRGA